MEAALRLLIDPPLAGALNMGVDDVLLAESADAGGALRLYRWREPTLSLGYFQSYDDPARRDDPALACLPVVRRVTGGGAILHAEELTYSLVLPPGHSLAAEAPAALYDWMHRRIVEAVAALGGRTAFKGGCESTRPRGGPFLCFERHACFDLVDAETGDWKFTGSAQRRTRAGVLQHGSVILRRSHPIQPSSSLEGLLGREANFNELADALVAATAAAGLALTAPERTNTETPAISTAATRHASPDWLRLR